MPPPYMSCLPRPETVHSFDLLVYRQFCRALGAGLLLVAQVQAAEPVPATIPYKVIAEVLDKVASINNHDRLLASARVLPAKEKTPTAPLNLVIHAKSGPVPVRVAADGSLIDFPLRPELRAEDPPVVSNQPKGTLQLQAYMALRYSGRLEESGAWYNESLTQANSAVKALAGALSFLAPKVRNLVFVYPAGTTNTVTLTRAGKTTVLQADKVGRIKVPASAGSELANTTLRLSAVPASVEAE